jgi:hypothetical protein
MNIKKELAMSAVMHKEKRALVNLVLSIKIEIKFR